MIPLDVPGLLRQFHLRPKKRLGQSFLVDEGALAKVAAAAEVTASDTILEIGPGLGSLTRHLAAARRVVAVEVDEALLPVLAHTLRPYPHVEVIAGDILQLPLAQIVGLGIAYKVVANLPYYITSAAIRHVLEAEARPALVVLTVQREVADRLCARPGDMSLLAVSVQFYAVPRIVARLSAGAFYPRPAVNSAVVRLEVLAEPALPGADPQQFFSVVKAGFSQKRKQLRNALSGGLGIEAGLAGDLLTQAGIDPRRRAETLALEEWGALARVVGKSGTAG